MTFNQYTASHKTWDHVGNPTPNVEYSESHRPHGEFMPADWLPVGRFEKYYEEYFTVSVGKVVAMDLDGRLVPAGLKTAFAVAAGDVLSYTATDITEGVIDLTTGITVAAAGGYTRAEITAALILRGKIDTGQNAEDFISLPVGVAPYNYYKWAGGDGFNPSQYTKANFNMQHRAAILCDYVIEVPLVPASATQIDLSAVAAIENGAVDDWNETGGRWKSNTALQATTRWAAAAVLNTDTVGLVLPSLSMAKSTASSTVTFSSSTDFARERNSIAELVQSGDYFIDYDVGCILLYESGGNAAPMATGTIDYYHYDNSPASVSTYACAIGDLKPGDLVRADANSNYVAAETFAAGTRIADGTGLVTEAELAAAMNEVAVREDEIVGQVLELETHPRDLLERVRTAYATLGTLDQMPGSATLGRPAALTYAAGADRMVRIRLLN